jgi:hypothetical protein
MICRRLYIPQDASPLSSIPLTDEVGEEPVLVEGLDTDGLEDGFVFVRNRAGDCAGVGTFAGGANPFAAGVNMVGAESGSCSDLKTLSKRARLKYDSS